MRGGDSSWGMHLSSKPAVVGMTAVTDEEDALESNGRGLFSLVRTSSCKNLKCKGVSHSEFVCLNGPIALLCFALLCFAFIAFVSETHTKSSNNNNQQATESLHTYSNNQLQVEQATESFLVQ
jgi:hypothetical protein